MVYFCRKTKPETKEFFVNLIASINKSSLKNVRTIVFFKDEKKVG